MSNLTEEQKVIELEKWNSNLAHEVLPDSILLGIYLVIGLTGNSLVLYIYLTRLRASMESRFFVPVLAVIDLISCCVNTSFTISTNSLRVRYNSNVACKIMAYLVLSTTSASAYMLLVIAIDRYKKICKPFERQITFKWKKNSVLIILTLVLILSAPCPLFYGSAPVDSVDGQVTGRSCTTVTFGKPTFAIIYFGIIFLIILVELVVLSVLYFLVGKTLFKHTKVSRRHEIAVPKKKWARKNDFDCATAEHAVTTETPIGYNETDIEKNECKKSSENIAISQNLDNLSHQREFDKEVYVTPRVKVAQRKVPGYHLSVIFTIITAVFIVCFFPKLVVEVYQSQKKNLKVGLSTSQRLGFNFLDSFFIINNIVNPFIYGFLDRRFQKELKAMCCRKQ